MKRKPNCICVLCKKEVYRRPIQIKTGNVYCSSKCCGQHQRKSHTCRICDKEYIGNKKTCSRACANIARAGIRYTGEGKNDKAKIGTLLKEKIAKKCGGICERCGETNYAILQIHHKKERHRGGTDAPSNLELLCPNCHTTHHLGFRLFRKTKNDTVLSHRK